MFDENKDVVGTTFTASRAIYRLYFMNTPRAIHCAEGRDTSGPYNILILSNLISASSQQSNADEDATHRSVQLLKNVDRYILMAFFTAPHATLYYDIFSPDITESVTDGPSSVVLLLHGFMGTPTSDFAAQLPRLTSQYTVLAPHLHGYGLSSHRISYNLSYYREDVADLVALLDALHLATVNVLAFSDGSIVALLLAALHPHRVRALAVLGAQANIDEQDATALRQWLLEQPLPEIWQQELTRLHGDPYWRSLLPMFVKGQEDLVQAGGILVTDEELAAIRCPTLLMHGKRDRVVRVEYVTMLNERIPHAHVLLFDAGHAAHLRHEQEFTETVMRFFAKPREFML